MAKADHPFTTQDYIEHGVFWNLFGLVKYIPPPIGDYLRTLVIRLYSKKFETKHVREGVTIWFPSRLTVGKYSTLNEWVYLNAYGGISIGNGVRIAPRVSIVSVNHQFEQSDIPIYEQGLAPGTVTIEDDVWLGIGAVVLSNVTIGKGAVIAAGAVVVKDVAPYSVMGGVPAKVISMRKTNTERVEDHA